jgi:cation transport ATPase-like protein
LLLTDDSNRQLDGFNIFEGVFRNWLFIAISLIMIGGQILITFVGGQAFSIVALSPAQWGYSVVLGAFSIAIGCIIRMIPDEIFERLIGAGSRTSLCVLNRLRLRRNPRTSLLAISV